MVFQNNNHVDELRRRFDENNPLLDDTEAVVIDNRLLIPLRNALPFLKKLWRNGYLIDSLYFYRVDANGRIAWNNSYQLPGLSVEPNWDFDTDFFWPQPEQILDIVSDKNGSLAVSGLNHIEIKLIDVRL